MLRQNNARLDTKRLNEQIRRRSEAAEPLPEWCGEVRWRKSLEGRLVELGASHQRGSRPVTDYTGLLGLPDADFLDAAYRCLLGRLPSVEERNRGQEQLMAGLAREQLLLVLADQTE
ncbi:MAG: hypothetical protein RI841_15670, partial [Halomonas sp.]|uniref:hypothetical protein n=1 Tax=Halomonas sp. TaxID=1486246 RepID=UPI0028702FCA